MEKTQLKGIIGWCSNDTCGEPIYFGDVKHIDQGEMYCDDCYIEQPVEEL